ncbi:DnaD domain-containing protein [Clostridium estertheticum]|uniref:DnaD domain-containing protein n=1 Tax=Clostridium estertheticum TaxID=238834 RepID=UPI001CF3B599|nr:DnaD domain protein [Clostridium estertheticum]MCB2357321.1 DnaD domain protein [Clostridium estertheticum]WAG41909.1 DnaD domain protein [Clostridium estertheticum]
MAKYRQIYTEFWSDAFVLELDSQEKLFYLYLLTNTKSTQCGIYELSPRLISLETGYDKVLVTELLKKFCDYKKILYCEETNEIMLLNWIKYNFPNNVNVIACIKKEAQKIKSKVLLKILYKKYEAAGLDVNNIFKGLVVNVIPTDINDLSPIKQEHSEDQSNNIIVMDTADESNEARFIKPLDTPLIGATKHMPSNRIRNKEEGVINKEQRIINKEEVEEEEVPKADVTTKKSLITRSENPAATAVGIKSIIKIFEENIHVITPLVYEKILDFTKHVSYEVIIMAIKEAVNYNAKNIKYISKVINSWISEGIKTAKEVVTYQKQWNMNNSSSSINSGSHSAKSGSFCDYEQRTYDFDLLEKQLLGID